jgi:benzoyl-CoA reductase subunit D
MAGRYMRLLTSAKAEGVVLVTGGLAADVGLLQALREAAKDQGADLDVRADERSVLAGALGAAIWGAFRARKLRDKGFSLTA